MTTEIIHTPDELGAAAVNSGVSLYRSTSTHFTPEGKRYTSDHEVFAVSEADAAEWFCARCRSAEPIEVELYAWPTLRDGLFARGLAVTHWVKQCVTAKAWAALGWEGEPCNHL